MAPEQSILDEINRCARGRSDDGLMARLARHHGNEAWRETVTRHMPEPWQAARLALQARIAALDIGPDETILDLTQDEAA